MRENKNFKDLCCKCGLLTDGKHLRFVKWNTTVTKKIYKCKACIKIEKEDKK